MPATLEKPEKAAIKAPDYSALFWVLLSYQTPAKLQKKIAYPSPYDLRSYSYTYICPRCDAPLDREFQRYCNNCGQKLDWINYRKAKLIKR